MKEIRILDEVEASPGSWGRPWGRSGCCSRCSSWSRQCRRPSLFNFLRLMMSDSRSAWFPRFDKVRIFEKKNIFQNLQKNYFFELFCSNFGLLTHVPFEDVRRVVLEREKKCLFLPSASDRAPLREMMDFWERQRENFLSSFSFCLFVCSLCFLRCERLLRFHPFLLTNYFSREKGWMKFEMNWILAFSCCYAACNTTYKRFKCFIFLLGL